MRYVATSPGAEAAPSVSATPAATEAVRPGRDSNRAVLVVDDAPAQRELARSILERLGYQVDAVGSGEEAVAYLQRQKVDLVVLDMILGAGMDGMETYRRLAEIRPGQKAVIVSGFSETERVAKVQAMGAGAFVRKPYLL